MLWSKYWMGTVPLLVLALAITMLTNWLLQAGAFMMAVSLGTIVLYTLAVERAGARPSASSTPSSAPRTRPRSPPASAAWST